MWLKNGVFVVRKWVGGVWNTLMGQRGIQDNTSNQGRYSIHMEAPADNDCCSICHDSFSLPCQANCAHWFCGECILRVWQHTSALQPCKCPICRRPITLLIPSELGRLHLEESKRDEIMRDIAKYNRIFGGGVVSFFQRVRDMPLLLRRLVRELMDPQRAIQLIHRTPILFYSMEDQWPKGHNSTSARRPIRELVSIIGTGGIVATELTHAFAIWTFLVKGGVFPFEALLFLVFYVFSPLDIIPEGIVGLVGLLDDLLVMVVVLFYLAMLYRSTLLLHHGGQ